MRMDNMRMRDTVTDCVSCTNTDGGEKIFYVRTNFCLWLIKLETFWNARHYQNVFSGQMDTGTVYCCLLKAYFNQKLNLTKSRLTFCNPEVDIVEQASAFENKVLTYRNEPDARFLVVVVVVGGGGVRRGGGGGCFLWVYTICLLAARVSGRLHFAQALQNLCCLPMW